MMTLHELAIVTGGVLQGSPETQICGVDTLAAARPGYLAFANDASQREPLLRTAASAVIVSPDLAQTLPESFAPAVLVCDEPKQAFVIAAKQFRRQPGSAFQGVSPQAFVADSAVLAPDVTIYPGCYVGEDVRVDAGTTLYPGVKVLDGCHIGRDVRIFPNAVLYENTIIGNRCVIHAGAVLGAWGFGYSSSESGHRLGEQLGHVEVGDDVEIGAAATIDRGTWGATRIGTGTKMDNQVQVGHNCQIGTHNLLCSQVGIAGSCQTGTFVVMAGQVGIADHVTISDRSVLCAKAGVMDDLDGGQVWLGARPVREQMQIFATMPRLPEMRRELKRLQKLIGESADTRAAGNSQPGEPERDAA